MSHENTRSTERGTYICSSTKALIQKAFYVITRAFAISLQDSRERLLQDYIPHGKYGDFLQYSRERFSRIKKTVRKDKTFALQITDLSRHPLFFLFLALKNQTKGK